MTVWDVAIWIRVHWFELAALALLLANLWFVFGILSVLRAINQALVFLSGGSDRTSDESTREEGPSAESGRGEMPARMLMGAHPVLVNLTFAVLSWALLVLIVVAVWAFCRHPSISQTVMCR
jgi:hypothetical protein